MASSAGIGGALLLLLALAPAAGRVAAPAVVAAPRAAPLTLAEVLAATRANAPQVLEALAKVRGAQGKRLSANAAFDTVFNASAETRGSGFYDGRDLTASFVQPLRDRGGYAYGGYRVSGGRFPIYEDERFTNQIGEIKAGAVLSLLRDRLIDDRRFGLAQADNEIDIADTERLMVAIGVQARALQAYNNWVAAGLRLAIYRDLYALAESRQVGFRRQVDTGARPRILLTENEVNLLRRQTLVVQSEAALAQAATSLSFFYRDADGRPLTVSADRLPAALADPLPLPAQPRAMIAARPDLRALDLRLRIAGARLAADRNTLLPKLDFKAEVSQDLGPIGAGGRSRVGTETKVGLSFTLPLQRSAARGRIAQTRAEIDGFVARRRAIEDQIVTDIDNLATAVRASARLAELAGAEAERATTMAAAERRRFDLGASDFFLVNVREEAAADARVRRLDAAVRQVVAHADLAAATADMTALGL